MYVFVWTQLGKATQLAAILPASYSPMTTLSLCLLLFFCSDDKFVVNYPCDYTTDQRLPQENVNNNLRFICRFTFTFKFVFYSSFLFVCLH